MLRKREYTKNEINELLKVEEEPAFAVDILNLMEAFRQGNPIKDYVAEVVLNSPLYRVTSVTWLVYEVCNAFNDHELGVDYLSELVVDIEDLVEELLKIIEKYKKIKLFCKKMLTDN